MGDEDKSGPAVDDFADALEALLGEEDVTNAEGFIDDQDIGLDTDGYREGEPHHHAGGVGLDGLLDEIADVREPAMRELICEARPDTVIHLASIVTPGKDSSRELEYAVDVLGTENVLNGCVAAGVQQIIVTSSGAAYGYHADNPAWLTEDMPLRGNDSFAYSHHKRLVEEMLAQYRQNHPQLAQTVLRIGTILGERVDNQITAFHPGAMQFSHENNVADVGPLRVAIIAPDGRDGMLKHARDCAALNVPFMFDPGQQLPMFSGAELIEFINQATYVAANDYEFEMLMDRTGLTLPQIAARLEALIITRGEKGSEIYTGGERHEIACVQADAVVDPTGCGDAFRAGLLYGIVNGYDWPTTGRLASVMGALKIAHTGGQNHHATPIEIANRFEAAFGYRY